MTLMTIVLAAAYMLFQAAGGMSDWVEAHSIAADETRLAMDGITQELRQAAPPPGRPTAFSHVSTGQVTFFVDADHDEYYEEVTYRRDGAKLLRTLSEPIIIDGTYTFAAPGPPRVLVSGLSPDWDAPIFTVMLRSGRSELGTTTPSPIAASQIASASAVAVHIRNSATVGSRTAVVDNTTWVKVRAVENEVH